MAFHRLWKVIYILLTIIRIYKDCLFINVRSLHSFDTFRGRSHKSQVSDLRVIFSRECHMSLGSFYCISRFLPVLTLRVYPSLRVWNIFLNCNRGFTTHIDIPCHLWGLKYICWSNLYYLLICIVHAAPLYLSTAALLDRFILLLQREI